MERGRVELDAISRSTGTVPTKVGDRFCLGPRITRIDTNEDRGAEAASSNERVLYSGAPVRRDPDSIGGKRFHPQPVERKGGVIGTHWDRLGVVFNRAA